MKREDDDDEELVSGNNDWKTYRLYVVETLKSCRQSISTLDNRVTNIEKRMYMVMGAVSILLFLLELYDKFNK